MEEIKSMNKIIDIIKSLPNLEKVGKVSDNKIKDAEIQLRLNFANEYRDYLAEFGSISSKDMELTGIISVEYCNVVSVTKQEWELNPKVPHTMYVIENTCVDGIIIWQDTNGSIYQTTPNAEPLKIASSLEEYLLNRIK